MLARLFVGQRHGCYVDVGAWHPVIHSVTKHFYDSGWQGVNVEPIREQFELFTRDRTRDINIQAAVGDTPGSLTLFECEGDTALSTASSEQAARLRAKGYHLVERK